MDGELQNVSGAVNLNNSVNFDVIPGLKDVSSEDDDGDVLVDFDISQGSKLA